MSKRWVTFAAVSAVLVSVRAMGQGMDSVQTASFRAVAAGSAAGVSGEAPARPFWRELGDATLAALVDEALVSSPDVRAAQARIREARGVRSESAFGLMPAVTSTATLYSSGLSSAQAPGVPASVRRAETWDGGVNASWEVDVFGRVRSGVKARGALVDAAGQDLRGVRLALAAEVARAYYDLLGARERVDVAARNAENQRRTLALVEERLRAGRGSAFDTERAKAQLATTLASLPLFASAATAAENRLAGLLGRPAYAAAPELGGARALPALPATVRVGSPARLVRERPDLASAERQVVASNQLAGSSRAELMPRLSLVGAAGLNAGAADDLSRDGARRYQAGVVVSWPFLDLGRVRARVGADRARADQAQAAYAGSVLRALAEAETSIAVYANSRARVDHLAEAARASERAAELARIRFREGVADFLSVLDAERTLLDAQNQLAAARVDAARALVDVYQATGQGVEEEEEPAAGPTN
jgi:multidrug efflux system outer membrane protein